MALADSASANKDLEADLRNRRLPHQAVADRWGTTEASVRRWRKKNSVKLASASEALASPYPPGASEPAAVKHKAVKTQEWQPGVTISGDTAEIKTPFRAFEQSPDDDRLLREAGLDPGEWYITKTTSHVRYDDAGEPSVAQYWLRASKIPAGGVSVEDMDAILAQYIAQPHSTFTALGSRILMVPSGDLQLGKALRDDTPMLTPSGWTTHGELRPGDHVYGPDGKPKEVLGVTGSSVMPMFRVVFDRGTEIFASAGHLWNGYRKFRTGDLRDENGTRQYSGGLQRRATQMSTAQLAELPRHKATSGRSATARPFHVDLTEPLYLEGSGLPVDPYLLGAWLGDGTTAGGSICGHKDDIGIILRGVAVTEQPSMRKENCRSFNVIGLSAALGKLGVRGNKHVPDNYLYASVNDRVSLLQGLMDTDGSCSKTGICEFTSTLPQLADSVHWLVTSLGMRAITRSKATSCNGKPGKTAYRVVFTPNQPVFRLPRKLDRQRVVPAEHMTRYRFVQYAEPAGEASAQCLHVEGGLYLAGRELVVTHNCEGGGTEATIERFARYTNNIATELMLGDGVELLILPWLGDCIEGIVSQSGRNIASLDMPITQQVRVYRRLMMHQLLTLAPYAKNILLPIVPGNHDETTRQQIMPHNDSWALEGASAVADWCEGREGFEHVSWAFPEAGEPHLAVKIADELTLGFTHGHVTGGNPAKVIDWWRGQSHGRQPLGEADILVSAHWHHLRVEFTGGGRTWIQVPAMDGGSGWYRQKTGNDVPSGQITVDLTPGAGCGWTNLKVYS